MVEGGGVPSAVIRFICHIPLGILGFDGIFLYNCVRSLDIFRLLPHGQTFHEGLRIVGQAGLAGFLWNFFMWIPTAAASGTILFLIGLADLALTIALLVGVIFQARYLPHTYSGCQDAETWQNATNSSNFFVVASNLSDFNGTTPHDVCYEYVQNWVFGIAIIILYMFSAIFNISFGGLIDDSSYYSYHGPTWVSRFFSAIYRYLVSPILSRLRYRFRYLSKSRQRVKVHNTIRLRPFKANPPKSNKPTGLAVALSYESQHQHPHRPPFYNPLVLVAYKLHYVDLINLSLVSKSLREVIFGKSDLATRSEDLRLYTCEDGSKSQCWICNTQICRSCSKDCSLPETEAFSHLKNCKAYCSECYFSQICRPGKSNHSRDCWLRQSSKKWYSNYNSLNHATRKLCQLCIKKTSKEQQSMRETQDRAEVRRLAQQPLSCSQCKVLLLTRGPRWWVCSACSSECRNHIHPPWAPEMEV